MLGFSNYILLINKQALSRGGERNGNEWIFLKNVHTSM